MTALTTPPAGEEKGERDDIANRLHAESIYARVRGHHGRAMLLEAAKSEIDRLRLLSSPRVEEVRREAFEEAAKVVTDAIDSMRARNAKRPDVDISALLLVADRIYQGIRSLSPQGG